MLNLEKLSTEARNPASSRIDKLDTLSMMRVMNDEDQKTALAVKAILPDIARAVDVIAARLKTGGRLFYMGSGTSGRLGILDAVECPPTYSTDPDLVQGLIAGGKEAIFRAREGAEDSLDKGADDIISHDLSVVEHIADEVMVMYLGRCVEMGTKTQIFNNPQHPYTQALLSATPRLSPELRRQRIKLTGELPSPINPPKGCAFNPRCWKATDKCRNEQPKLEKYPDGKLIACFHLD